MEGFNITYDLAVPWGHMDAFGHVNNVRYLEYFESARIAYFEAMRILDENALPQGVGPILADSYCKFIAPVTFPDRLRIGVRVNDISPRGDRFQMEYLIESERLGRPVAVGTTVVVSVDYETGAKCDLPEKWLHHIESIEGELPTAS